MATELNASQALARLIEGNKTFVGDENAALRTPTTPRKDAPKGQSPYAIILSCADSRVPPEVVFNESFGELFVIRVAGNIANTSSIASIEYAVHVLKVKLIVVLGHESCGAVQSAIDKFAGGANLDHLLNHIKPAIRASSDPSTKAVVHKNAELTAEALIHNSDIISGAAGSGKDDLHIIPAYYNLGTGVVDGLDAVNLPS